MKSLNNMLEKNNGSYIEILTAIIFAWVIKINHLFLLNINK